jgi:hypothetical protein
MSNINELRNKLEAARKNLKDINQGTMLFNGKNFEKAEIMINEMLKVLEVSEVLYKAAEDTINDGMQQGVKFGNLASAVSLYEQGSMVAPGSALNEAKARMMRK